MAQKFLPLPPREELLRRFSYDPETGLLTRLDHPAAKKRYVGTQVMGGNGRQRIVVVGCQNYIVSRVIWFMVTGVDPGSTEVDHRDTNPMNDRWDNLRLAGRTSNMANIGLRKDNKFGIKGVLTYRGGYRARLRSGGKDYFSCKYTTPEEAGVAYRELAEKHHAQFARY